MANLSYQYYKGYYKKFEFWNNYKSDDKLTKEKIELYFNNRNKIFKDFKLADKHKIVLFGTNQFELSTTYPGLLIGSGYTHGIGAIGEFKIGFHFDYSTGLPLIPGSSVKGLLRSAFPDFKKELPELENKKKNEFSSIIKQINHVKACWMLALLKEIDQTDFLTKYIAPLDIPLDRIPEQDILTLYKLQLEIFEGVSNYLASSSEEKYHSIYKRDIFYDSLPISSSHIDSRVLDTDSITPHGENPLRNPTPLLFLKVLPNVKYRFQFDLKKGVLESSQKEILFKKILLTIGIGAKTNVGYGQFQNENTNLKIKDKEISKSVATLIPYAGSIRRGNIIIAEVTDQIKSQVKIIFRGETIQLKLCGGNCPPNGTIVEASMNVGGSKGNERIDNLTLTKIM